MAYYTPFNQYAIAASTSGRSNRNTGKRERTSYTADQLKYLESKFVECQYPEPHKREIIALDLGLEDNKIQIWFKNRRAKGRQQSKQTTQMDTLRRSTGSISSGSSTDKSSPSSKVDCSPDSTTTTPYSKKEDNTTIVYPPSTTVPSSITSTPLSLVYPQMSDSTMSNGLAPKPTSSPPGATVPMFQPFCYPWMMAGFDSVPPPPSSLPDGAAPFNYGMQYHPFQYGMQYYPVNPLYHSQTFNSTMDSASSPDQSAQNPYSSE